MRAGLLGEHLGHSFSPLIHGELANYSYKLCEVEKESLADFMTSGSIDAFNVTIPYKQAVMPYLDRISDRARRIGAVNTVVRRADGKLCGYNTDYFGFSYMIDRLGVDINGKKALVLGRGGAALTVRAVLTDKGAREIVMLGSGDNTPENIKKHSDAEIIVNATPIGMKGHSADQSPVNKQVLSTLPKDAIVYDIIYNPTETILLKDAEKLGYKTISGLDMLVAQAVEAQRIWFGITPNFEKIRG